MQAWVSELSMSWTSWDLQEEVMEVKGDPVAQRGSHPHRDPPYPLRPSVRTQRLVLRLQAQ